MRLILALWSKNLRGWLGLLALIVGFHFWGAWGFWLALIGYIGLYLILARIEADRSQRQYLSEMIDRGNLR